MNEQYDFYSYGMRVAKDLYSNVKNIANDIEKKYGKQARLEFESGIAVSIPTYSTYFNNQSKIEKNGSVHTSTDFNETRYSGTNDDNNFYSDRLDKKGEHVTTREEAIELIKSGVIEDEYLKLLEPSDKNIIIDYIKNQKLAKYHTKLDTVHIENINVLAKYYNNDKEIILEAVKQVPLSLQYASDELKNDKNIIFNALENNLISRTNTDIFQYASDQIKNDKEFIIYLIQRNPSFCGIIRYTSDQIRNDRDVMSRLLNDKADWMEFAGEKIKNDKEFILNGIERRPSLIKYASNELKSNKQFLLDSIKHNHQCFRYFNEELKSDKEFAKEAVKIHCFCFSDIDEKLKSDEEIINLALEQKKFSKIDTQHFGHGTGIWLDYHGNIDYIRGVDITKKRR